MRSRLAGVLAGSLLLCLAAAPAALAHNRHVNVRVEGLHRTLVDETLGSLSHGPVDPDGNPTHTCSGSSALGALNAATGDYTAAWFSGLGYQINSVRGEEDTYSTDHRYWSFWVNDAYGTVGLCDYKPKRGDDILLFPCAKKCPEPLGIHVRHHAQAGHRVRVRVVAYSQAGKAQPVRHARVHAGHAHARTNRHGIARLRLKRPGAYEVRATKGGHFVRSERETVEVR